MWSRRLAYLAALAAGGLFFLFFRGYLSFFTLLFLVALPVLSFVWLLLSWLPLRVSLEAGQLAAERRESFVFRVRVASRRALPVPCVRVSLRLCNALGGGVERRELYFPFSGRESSAELTCRSACCGRVCAEVRRARALDFLRLFSLPVRAAHTAEVFVLPSRKPAPSVLSENSLLQGFGELTLPTRPGSDFSELTGTREYREGDPLHRVHWKLTEKTGALVVRQGSRPASRSLRFLLEYGDKLEGSDAMLEVFSRLAFLLAGRGVPAEVCWISGGEITSETFEDEDGVSLLLRRLLSVRPSGSALELFRGEERWKCAHLLYVTSCFEPDQLSLLLGEESASRFTVLQCLPPAGEQPHSPVVIPMVPERLETCLSEVEL